jgi:Domain of unknown function (DUF4263)
MSIAFVDREPDKQEIEHLRQLLGQYDRVPINSPFFPNREFLKEIIAEACGITSNELCGLNPRYKIEITPQLISEKRISAVKKRKYPFSAYWDYLSKFNVTMENYRENPAIMGAASVDLFYEFDNQLDFDLSKSSFLDLVIGEGKRAQLNQYPYYVDPQKLRWCFEDVSNEYGSIDYLRGYDTDMVFSIVINKHEILRYSSDLKKPNNNRRRKKYYQSISIEYFLSQYRRVWCSDIFQIEPLSASQVAQFHATAAAKEQKEAALAQLEEYIRTDPEEREFQKLLAENKWVFGHEYSEFLDKRELVIDSQQDFVGRRATDGFWDIIEIKRSLNGISLFKEDKSHNTLYPGVELSKAIGQVIHYIDRIDRRHDNILIDRGIDTNKVRVKLIIGRDGDDRQGSALHNLNSHLNRIEIRTYDQLLKGARSHLADY